MKKKIEKMKSVRADFTESQSKEICKAAVAELRSVRMFVKNAALERAYTINERR